MFLDLSEISRDDWIHIYETLREDGHLSEEGLNELKKLKG